MARRSWSGVVTVEGVQTGDGRVFTDGCFVWDDAALAAGECVFRWDREDDGAHAGAVEIGRVTELARQDGGLIVGRGWVEDTWPDAADWIERAEAAGNMGVSMDGDDYEVQVIDTTMEAGEAAEDDDVLYLASASARAMRAAAGDPDPGAEGGTVLFEAAAGDVIERWTRCRIRGVTSCDIPAFDNARVSLDGTDAEQATEDATEAIEEAEAAAAELVHGAAHADHGDCGCAGTCGSCGDQPAGVVAAGTPAPQHAPRAWYAYDADLMAGYRAQAASDEFGSVRCTDDGRVYGYVSAWGVCHTGYQGECVLTPRSASNYGHFRTGYVVCADGSEVATGRISLGGGHADLRLSYAATIDHYDDVTTAVADVAVGEDEFGIWFAGALRPGTTTEHVHALRASPLSGDWRPVGNSLEMVAAHAVNVAGFPIPRARVAGGRVQALIAAGAGRVPASWGQPGAPDAATAHVDVRLATLERIAANEARRRLAAHAARRRAEAVARLTTEVPA